MDRNGVYDVLIGGGGVTGTSLAYILTHFTNVRSVLLLEQYGRVARVNSATINNSQTLHSGEIETNFTLEKALQVKEAARLLAQYLERHGSGGVFLPITKMVLGVGDKEVAELERRFGEFSPHFPNLEKLGRDEIARREPNVIEGRDPNQKVVALFSKKGYAVDYQKLAESFVSEAQKSAVDFEVLCNTEIKKITRDGSHYAVVTNFGTFNAKVVVLAAGPYSLLFAHALGYQKEYAILPVAGSFYLTDQVLNGKVYTVQIPKIPFAAVHGDPAVYNPAETRFGPTAKILPLLERHHYETFFDFVRTGTLSLAGIASLFKIISDRDILFFALKNIVYDMPVVGKWLFLRSVRKIIPTMQYRKLRFAKGAGGIRPQVINTRTKTLEMGAAKILGDRIIFNITPSPGASVCLQNAVIDAHHVIEFLGQGFAFDEEKFGQEFQEIS